MAQQLTFKVLKTVRQINASDDTDQNTSLSDNSKINLQQKVEWQTNPMINSTIKEPAAVDR